MRPITNNIGGFTLIELLVVIAIISLLSSVVFASVEKSRSKARDAVRISDARQIQLAVELYYSNNGQYPHTSTPSQVLIGRQSDLPCPPYFWCQLQVLLQPYLKQLPVDPVPIGPDFYGPVYVYDSNPGDNYQTYGVSVELENPNDLSKNDGGTDFNDILWEIGPQIQYCNSKYPGPNEGWDAPRAWNASSFEGSVCYGGN